MSAQCQRADACTIKQLAMRSSEFGKHSTGVVGMRFALRRRPCPCRINCWHPSRATFSTAKTASLGPPHKFGHSLGPSSVPASRTWWDNVRCPATRSFPKFRGQQPPYVASLGRSRASFLWQTGLLILAQRRVRDFGTWPHIRRTCSAIVCANVSSLRQVPRIVRRHPHPSLRVHRHPGQFRFKCENARVNILRFWLKPPAFALMGRNLESIAQRAPVGRRSALAIIELLVLPSFAARKSQRGDIQSANAIHSGAQPLEVRWRISRTSKQSPCGRPPARRSASAVLRRCTLPGPRRPTANGARTHADRKAADA